MLRPLLIAAASALVLGACASSTQSSSATKPETAETVVVSPYNLALRTADELVAARNMPTAIQRLMQLVGDTSLSPQELGEVLFRLGVMSGSPTGYDAEGAVDYLTEVLTDYPATDAAPKAAAALPGAKTAVAGHIATLESVSATRSEQFLALFNLGRHQEAIDVVVTNDLLPGNEELLAMYQIGYLCEDSNLTGRAYAVTDRDGTGRSLRFCDFGK